MTDEQKKPEERFAGWQKAVDANEAAAGNAKSIMKKALALNPELKGDKSTQEFFDEMKALQSQSEKKPAQPEALPKESLLGDGPRAQSVPVAATLSDLLIQLKTWLAAEDARLNEEAKTAAAALDGAQKARAAVALDTLKTVLDAFVKLDPNLSSPRTQHLLTDKAAFFKTIGFSADVLKEHRKRKRP